MFKFESQNCTFYLENKFYHLLITTHFSGMHLFLKPNLKDIVFFNAIKNYCK